MTKPKTPTRRCAVYSRKSSEEGLDQDFNSLHAQREACEAFIRSQQGQGWRLVETAYDDGGLSGGSLERPALQRLFADIAHGRIDTVVVYKVDRLTRSLMAFAKIVELFDRHGVSFVAVTQQFNTTTSMGRLTLNILLSFAQFEREVTGERIRDKIAASKRKGMWMGGVTPLGYEVKHRKLAVVPDEAETVRSIYTRYLELGSVRLLQWDLEQRSIRSKVRIYADGSRAGGNPFARGALYALLANPVYIGEIAHKGDRHPGQHEAIIDRVLWDAVQMKLRERGSGHNGRTGKVAASPLMGKLFDEAGNRLTPSHSVKDGRRYRYYVSRSLVTGTAKQQAGWRLPAPQLERIIGAAAAQILADRSAIAGALAKAGVAADRWNSVLTAADDIRRRLLSEQENAHALATVIDRIELRPDAVRLSLSLASFLITEDRTSDADVLVLAREIPLQIRRRGVEMRLVIESDRPAPAKTDPTLLKEIIRARRCFDALRTGNTSIAELAEREGVDDRYVSCVLPLAFLAPEIVEAIAQGIQPADLNATKLVRRIDLALDWNAQKRQLGFK